VRKKQRVDNGESGAREELRKLARDIAAETCWESPEARKLFIGDKDSTRDVKTVVGERLTLLFAAHLAHDGYKSVIAGADADKLFSDNDKMTVRLKAQCVCTALTFALEEMNGIAWEACCQKAIAHLAKSGIKCCNRAYTVAGWHTGLRKHGVFPCPHRFAGKDKVRNPPFFDLHPDEKAKFIAHAKKNLARLSLDSMREYVHDTLVPSGMEEPAIVEELSKEGARLKRMKDALVPDTPISAATADEYEEAKEAHRIRTDL